MKTPQTTERENTRRPTGVLGRFAGWSPGVLLLLVAIRTFDALDAEFLKLDWIPRPGEPERTTFTIVTLILMVLIAVATAVLLRRQFRTMRSQASHHATLAQRAPVGIFQTDSEGRCVYVNSRWSAMSGLDAHQASREGWHAAVHAEDRDRVSKRWQEAADKGLDFGDEYRLHAPHGRVTWVACTAIAMRDVRGQLTGYLGTLTEISTLKESQNRLREAVEDSHRAAQRERLLRQELEHRTRNNFTSILGVLRMREHDHNSKHAALMAVRSAIQAYERVNDLISQSQGPVEANALIWHLVRTLTPAGAQSQIMLSGDLTKLSDDSASSMSMVIQELLTNSMKHGALAQPDGRVTIEAVDAEGSSRQLRLTWIERGGHPVPEIVEGIGFTIIRSLVEHELGGTMKIEAGAELRVEIHASIQPGNSLSGARVSTLSGASARVFGERT